MRINSLCVFCGSSFGNERVYREKTIELGRYLGQNRIRLVYGGGGVGLMGALAGAVLEAGGEVTGVIPELIFTKVKNLPVTETIVTGDMHERKSRMYEMSDAFTALPGGIGTIEELSEVFTWQQLGYHSKAVSVFDINDFYKNFLGFLNNASSAGFIKNVHLKRLIVENDPASLIKELESYDGKTIDKWSNNEQ
ncbi:MAG: TIGR00730 family Rossman fold protein [Spirochaetales bacterium]|uniref:Cytokinin riboside 5'-monophosphate phosphoribohydrolase n=1 Tax=Candidatus Thalassospirochaeta sargassi TaxID=3119039 RepID=A0AAJ1MM52_9SPIO|nr:TIGR00730 family Rossman fold protein [Spirochaetales bacterium]